MAVYQYNLSVSLRAFVAHTSVHSATYLSFYAHILHSHLQSLQHVYLIVQFYCILLFGPLSLPAPTMVTDTKKSGCLAYASLFLTFFTEFRCLISVSPLLTGQSQLLPANHNSYRPIITEVALMTATASAPGSSPSSSMAFSDIVELRILPPRTSIFTIPLTAPGSTETTFPGN